MFSSLRVKMKQLQKLHNKCKLLNINRNRKYNKNDTHCFKFFKLLLHFLSFPNNNNHTNFSAEQVLKHLQHTTTTTNTTFRFCLTCLFSPDYSQWGPVPHRSPSEEPLRITDALPDTGWWFGVAVMRRDRLSCSTLSPVSTGMGDCLQAGKLSLRNQPPRPTQPGHPSVGRRNEYWRWLRPSLGKKMATSA